MRAYLLNDSENTSFESSIKDIAGFLGDIKSAKLLCPGVLENEVAYADRVIDSFKRVGVVVSYVRLNRLATFEISEAKSIFLGGGNAYKLLANLHESKLLMLIKERFDEGIPLVAWNSGSVLCGKSVVTSGDWNIISCHENRGLGIIDANIHCNYRDDETIIRNIRDYHLENPKTVLGMEAQSGMTVLGKDVSVLGLGRVFRFNRNKNVTLYQHGDAIPLEFPPQTATTSDSKKKNR